MLQSANMENGASPESVLEASFGCPTVIHMSPLLNTPEIQVILLLDGDNFEPFRHLSLRIRSYSRLLKFLHMER